MASASAAATISNAIWRQGANKAALEPAKPGAASAKLARKIREHYARHGPMLLVLDVEATAQFEQLPPAKTIVDHRPGDTMGIGESGPQVRIVATGLPMGNRVAVSKSEVVEGHDQTMRDISAGCALQSRSGRFRVV
jgi:hypothetical protein